MIRHALVALAALAGLTACSRTAPASPPAAPPTEVPAARTCPVEIEVRFPGAGATLVETEILQPLEAALAAGGTQIESEAREGMGHLRIWQSDPQAVRRAIEQVRLPEAAEVPIIHLPVSQAPTHLLVLPAQPTEDRASLRTRAEALAQRIEQAGDQRPARVDLLAPAAPEVRITLDPQRMAALATPLATIVEALRRPQEQAIRGSGGGDFVIGIRGRQDVSMLGDTVVAERSGQAIRLRDVAQIEVHTPPLPQAWSLGGPSAPVAVLRVEGPLPAGSADGAQILGPFEVDRCGTPTVRGAVAIAQLGAAPAEELLAWARRLHANSPASGGLVLVTALLGQASAELFLPTADEAGARDLAQRLRQSEPGNATVLAPGEPTFTLTVTHPDLDTLRHAHATIVARLQADGRVLGPHEGPRTAPELRIQLRPPVDPGEPRPADLPQALQALTGTLEVADLYEGARRLPVRLRLGPELSPQQLTEAVLPLTRGPTRLADVANISWEETTAHILRINRRRAARITVIGASKTLPTLEAELIPAWKGAFPGLEVRIQNGV